MGQERLVKQAQVSLRSQSSDRAKASLIINNNMLNFYSKKLYNFRLSKSVEAVTAPQTSSTPKEKLRPQSCIHESSEIEHISLTQTIVITTAN